ncbi:MAG: hypothetical protein K0U38_10335 [Epsilonproteobacteria bacterium]|nr:hypothetical protein [Campylobacterota bacterium]
MRKIFSIFLLFTLFINAQSYQEQWQNIEKLEQQNLPKSALKEVNTLYQQAKEEQNENQLIKALLHREKYQITLQEDGEVKAIQSLEKELTKPHKTTTKLILKSILAQMYANYLDVHYYTIHKRTALSDNNSSDIRTWDVKKLIEKASQLYLHSLQEEAQYIPIEAYQEILHEAKNAKGLRPTLYDFLAFRALKHFNNERTYITQPAHHFYIDEAEAFGNISTFIQHPFTSTDKSSFKYQTLKIYQELLSFHLKQKRMVALHHINFERLQFVYKNFEGTSRDELYLHTLNHLQSKYSNSETPYYLAKYHYDKEDYTQAIIYANTGIKSQNAYLVSRCQAIKNQIESQKLHLEMESVNLPNENLLAKVAYRNSSHIYIKVIKLTQEQREQLMGIYGEEKRSYVNSLASFNEFNLSLPKTEDYKEHTTEISLGAYEIGSYLFVVSKDKAFKNRPFYTLSTVSKLGYLRRNREFLVIDRASGEPLQGVNANFYTHSYEQKSRKNIKKFVAQRQSDKDGLVKTPKLKESYSVHFSDNNDSLYFEQDSYYNYPSEEQRKRSQNNVYFFTDRAIYRPSQTIYFKGLATKRHSHKKPEILTNQSITVTFYSANNQKVSSKKFKTDEFGTFHGSFTAPQKGRMGAMYLRSNIGGSKNIQVEEYKRPKFEVNFNALEKSYRLGDTVTITGEAKSYSGYGLENAKVSYKVRRVAKFPWLSWWRPKPISPEVQVAQGEIKTDANGHFSIKFEALADKPLAATEKPTFTYEISVETTDSTGETQSANETVTLGYVAINAQMIIERELDKNAANVLKLNTTNLDGEFQALQGKVVIEKFKPKDRVYRKRYWTEVDQPLYSKTQFEKEFKHYEYSEQKQEKTEVQTLKFDTKASKELMLSNLEQGEYLLTLHTSDKYGTKVQKSQKITIYDHDSSIPPPYQTDLWHKTDKESYEVGSTATLHLKSSSPDTYVLLGIVKQGELVEEKWLKINEVNKELIKISKEDRGDVYYHINLVKNNRVYNHTKRISVPWDRELKVEFLTFRDKLKPDMQEQWRIKISGEKREEVMAQMVATMYDASLDAFVSPNFNIPNLFPTYQSDYSKQWKAQHFNIVQNASRWMKPSKPLHRTFHTLNWFGLNTYGSSRYLYAESTMAYASPPSPAPAPMVVAAEATTTMSAGNILEDTVAKEEAPKAKKQAIKIRSDLQETMFFKPDLQTDKEGNIIIDFKTNDALTRWKFLGFVHTKALQTALATKEIVTQKELMVVTNLPRFFRERDSITLSSKIVNMSAKDLNGSCELQLINPIDNQPIFPDQNLSRPFHVQKGASTVVSFQIKVPDVNKIPAIQHTFIAKTHTHSDAEQVLKPILANRMFVTESKTVAVKGKEEKSFSLNSLKENNSNTLKHHRLTLEVTSNPAWYAMKSLPYLIEYPHECSEQLFNRYFANAIAAKIANSSPKIKKIFESWKSKKQLQSALSSNQELKSLLLEETPWVLNAQSQEEQQKNIGLLFDLHKLALEEDETINKLMHRQLKHKDAWPWFDGGEPNWYITQYIIEGFGKLKKLGIDRKDLHAPMGYAIAFIDKKMLKEYQTLQKNVENGHTRLEDDHLSSILVHYLYARSLYTYPMREDIKKAHDYYLAQAKEYWTKKALYEQGLIALTFKQRSKNSDAMSIVKSLKERALVDDEKGMYFKYTHGFHWNKMPIETHALMIEVFESIANDKEAVEQLKIWLLKNKQTTDWKTTKATASAIYALLSNNEWLSNDKLVDVSFDTKIGYQPILEKAKTLAQKGTGYYKATFDNFDKSMSTLTLTNPNSNIAWGGLYWQYFEELDKIKTFKETPLTIDKKLFLVKQSKAGDELIAIDKLPLKVGDKVKVRIEIRVDRDMEYIMLKDSRASAFEPINTLSQYKWQDGLGYYESTKDSATYFFIDYLRRGTYVFEYPLFITHKGEFSNGIATIESMYAPEFRSHSRGERINVK